MCLADYCACPLYRVAFIRYQTEDDGRKQGGTTWTCPMVIFIFKMFSVVSLNSKAGVPLAEPLDNVPLKRQRAKFKNIFFLNM